MTFAWELFLAAVCAAVVIGPGYVYGRHQLDQRRHTRTLANIARLERELGYDVPLETRIDRELGIHATDLSLPFYGETLHRRPLDREPVDGREPAHRIYGHCEVCRMRVALNAGRCRGATRDDIGNTCAKLQWASEAR